MKLSIIITVYNKEPYLRRALDSLLEQEDVNKEDYEILAVNDGSTDGSVAILEQYASKALIRIHAQNNQGLSMARNNGVKAASGDYIWFVDADDVYSTDSVRLILEAITYRPDVIPIYAKFKGIESIENYVNPHVVNGKDVLLGNWSHCGVFWVLRKDFLLKNDLWFYPGIYHEDSEFTPRMLYKAETIKVIPEVLYFVDCDPNSITQVPRPKRAFDCLLVAEHLYDFIERNHERGTVIGKVFDYNISVIINNGLDVIVKNSPEEQQRFNTEFRKKNRLMQALMEAPMIKYRIEALLFKLFPGHYVGIYKFLKHLS